MAVVHLGEMIERTGLFGEREEIAPAVVFDVDVSFFDINVWRPVFPIVPSLIKWQSGCTSRIANSTFKVPTTLFTCVITCFRSIIE